MFDKNQCYVYFKRDYSFPVRTSTLIISFKKNIKCHVIYNRKDFKMPEDTSIILEDNLNEIFVNSAYWIMY